MMKRQFFLVFLILLILPVAYARTGHIKLLAVSDDGETQQGSTADIYLEIKQGTGKMFIDSFPLTKVDTQISTRFAKEIACDFLDRDCSKYDFFYTIRAGSAIVGGPSAGAAITVLTISVLDNIALSDDISITGTINSGGLIGPVGGILLKIDAAAAAGITKVLIPKWSNINESNLSESRDKYPDMDIIEVSSLHDAVELLTGKLYPTSDSFSIPKSYKETMNNISVGLCDRTYALATYYDNTSIQERAYDLYTKGNISIKTGDYYSGASYCFGANLNFNYLRFLNDESLNEDEIKAKLMVLLNSSATLKKEIKARNKTTITDLQTYMIVTERITEANEYLADVLENIEMNQTNESLYNLAFGIERLNSAYSWSVFFDTPGKKYKINEDSLRKSCLNKISETEARLEYLKIYLPSVPDNIQKGVSYAYSSSKSGDYAICLYQASKTKADIDVILNSVGMTLENTDEVIEERIDIVEEVIARLTGKEVFPIIGYSYYEYANSLKESDKYSSLLYLEYALELGKMEIYFERDQFTFPLLEYSDIVMLIAGGLIGFFSAFILMNLVSRKKKSGNGHHKKK